MWRTMANFAALGHGPNPEATREPSKQATLRPGWMTWIEWLSLGIAALFPLSALVIQWLLPDFLDRFVWVFFFPAVFFGARVFGFWGGMASTLVSIALVWQFFLPPGFSLGIDDTHVVWAMLAFLFVGWLVSDALERLRRANKRIAESNAQLIATNRELEAFSYSVSHDLRAPLRSIDGFSQVLLEEYAGRLDETGRDCAARIRRAAQHMGMLIDDMLNLARVTQADVMRTRVDLSAEAREIADALRSSAPERKVEFAIADGIEATGDARLLRIALTNLLANAWKFTRGRTPPRIEFGREPVDGVTAYFIRDNGVGFDMAYVGKLFNAFQRLHDAREFPGSGIGLATVQRVVTKHGGRAWAQAEPGNGAVFYFTLEPTVQQ